MTSEDGKPEAQEIYAATTPIYIPPTEMDDADLAYLEKSIVYGITLIVGWFVLEYFMYYIPLSILKPKADTSSK